MLAIYAACRYKLEWAATTHSKKALLSLLCDVLRQVKVLYCSNTQESKHHNTRDIT